MCPVSAPHSRVLREPRHAHPRHDRQQRRRPVLQLGHLRLLGGLPDHGADDPALHGQRHLDGHRAGLHRSGAGARQPRGRRTPTQSGRCISLSVVLALEPREEKHTPVLAGHSGSSRWTHLPLFFAFLLSWLKRPSMARWAGHCHTEAPKGQACPLCGPRGLQGSVEAPGSVTQTQPFALGSGRTPAQLGTREEGSQPPAEPEYSLQALGGTRAVQGRYPSNGSREPLWLDLGEGSLGRKPRQSVTS